MKKGNQSILALAMMQAMFTGPNLFMREEEEPKPHKGLKVKPEVIPNGCDRWTFYGFSVIALNEKSAKRKCEKLYIKAYGRKP